MTMSRTVTIGLIADPGLPNAVAGRLARQLPRSLERGVDRRVTWKVQASRETLPLTNTGEIPLVEHAPRLLEDNEWDAVVYLSELPRQHDGDAMVAEVDAHARAALVSLPTLGAWHVTGRTRNLVVRLIMALTHHSERTVANFEGHGETEHRSSESAEFLIRRGRWSQLRLLAGMVRNNRPGRILPALSSSAAAAAGTGAFGIFYASIWSMADSLAAGRLALISVLVIAALSFWLIFHNDLWTSDHGISGRESPWLDNAATVITVALTVGMMYVALYAVLLGAAFAIITNDYLSTHLQRPASVLDHMKLTWLAASLGMMGGALGSNFDSDQAIREATYSRREQERRRLAKSTNNTDQSQ